MRWSEGRVMGCRSAEKREGEQCHSGGPTWTTKSRRSGSASSRSVRPRAAQVTLCRQVEKKETWRQIVTGAPGRPFQEEKKTPI